ncbi:amino acid/polyamine/organocation transporter, APC superfamily [Granulicella rosea]|uniref:Amino acid/polyamine/organocation transporter, APC superfamily n=1 Tax=Granulicella rosea TaxID=474952 RepID=A0A239KPP4_9BACT|nr:amino acid permease [Granulicella rosea]SNT20131.1 amino acid/polyamine/organocation transporter, APC superfamily [Granulicella rosea]
MARQIFATKSIDKLISESESPEHALRKTLGPVSLTALGIGAVIGSGIFTVIGTAIGGNPSKIADWKGSPIIDLILGALHGHAGAVAGRPGAGPALALSLVLVAIVCGLTGLCYAELASMIPIAGSAYTYTYATLGELIAWIIGWDLILEYAFSNMSVSVGFAAHIVDLLDWLGIHLDPKWLSPAYLPLGLQDLAGKDIFAAGWHFGFDIPAFIIVLLLTVVLVRGIRESARTNNIMVLVKIAAILLFIFFGLSFIHPANYHPFSPNGYSGVLAGGSIIFFTYIGFDSVSTASEECRNPRRDVPIGIVATLIVCTILYIGVAAVLTGMVPWQSVAGDGAPVVNALKRLSLEPGGGRLHWVRLGVLIGAIVGMISSILVFQLGQARVWFAMSRDKLLPDIFSSLHPKFRTPAFATWFAGILVAIPSGLFDVGTFAEMSNIGTLFAFVLVSIGVIVLRAKDPERRRGFRVPFGPVIPILSTLFCILLMAGLPAITWVRFFVWLIIGLFVYFFYSRKRSEFYKG